MKSLFILLTIFFLFDVNGQLLPSHNEFQELGVRFDIPPGWSAEQQGENILMGHESIPGYMILSANKERDINKLKAEALKGVYDAGVQLRTEGEFEIANDNSVSGYYVGVWNGENVKCFAYGRVNTLGDGVNVMVITTQEMFSETHVVELKKLTDSIEFIEPKISDQSATWRAKLVPSLVKYISSSYSSDYSGGSTGTSSTESITLCSNGYFSYYSSDRVSYGAGDGAGGESGFGSVNSNGSSVGNFEIQTIGQQTYLLLNFENGEIFQYALSMNEKGYTFLNETRYFVVETTDCY